MPSWAIVVGINKYWTPEACLKGAVRDALHVREWLLNPEGGNIAPSRLALLLGPTEPSQVPAGVAYSDATKDNLIQQADLISKRSGGKGERFFFYYSGHGLTGRLLRPENALAMANFTDLLTENSVGLQSLFDYFKTTQFQEQFFFIDACRNIPWEGQDINVGRMPSRSLTPGLPEPLQYRLYATSDGVRAAEIGEAGNEGGVFTQFLLAGLGGAGKAKAWKVDVDEYVVTVDRLFAFVKEEVVRKKIDVSRQANQTTGGLQGGPAAGFDAARFIQVPQGDGGFGTNPVLASFPTGQFPPEKLEVLVEPTSVAPQSEISVRDNDLIEDQKLNPQNLPVIFTLPPREYVVRVWAPDHRPEQPKWQIDLYGPHQHTVRLVPGAGGDRPIRRPPIGYSETMRDPKAATSRAHITIQSHDPLAPLEVADSTGTVLKVGNGRLEALNLKPGFYQARLRPPEGPPVEQSVELIGGVTAVVWLDAPPPAPKGLVPDLVRNAHLDVLSDNTLQVSETVVGPIATPSFSTLLSLAGAVAHEGTTWGTRLRNLGLQGFTQAMGGATSGIQIVFGDEASAGVPSRQFLQATRLWVWPQDGPVPANHESPSPLPTIWRACCLHPRRAGWFLLVCRGTARREARRLLPCGPAGPADYAGLSARGCPPGPRLPVSPALGRRGATAAGRRGHASPRQDP
jgi:Caspase domain